MSEPGVSEPGAGEPAEPQQKRPTNRLAPVIRGFLALGFATIVGQVIGFVVLVLVARRAGPENMGAYSFALSFSAYFEIPIDFGITMYAIRELARRPDRVREIVGEVAIVQFVLLVICLTVVLALGPALMPDGDAVELLPIVVAAWIPTALSLDWAMRGLQNMRAVALWRLAGQVVYGALAPLLIGAGLAGVKTYAWLNVVGAAVSAIGISVLLVRMYGMPRFSLNLRTLARRYAHGAVVGVSLAIVMIYYQTDILLLGYLRDEQDTGLFGVAYRVPANIVLIGTVWLQAAYPYAAALIASEPLAYLRQLGRTLSVAAALALPIAAGGAVLATELMVGLFGPEYRDAALPFALLTASAAIALVQVQLSNAVLALGQDRRYFTAVSTAAVVNIAIAVVLIPPLGPSGAAIATIAAELTLIATMLVRVRKQLGTPPLELRRVAASMAATLAMVAVLLPLRSQVSVWICLALGGAVYLAGALTLGVIGRDELQRLVRRGGR